MTRRLGLLAALTTALVGAAPATAQDPGAPTFDVQDVRAVEPTLPPGRPLSELDGDEGFADVVVTLSAPSTRQTVIGYTSRPGTARLGLDYRKVEGVLVFEPGETAKAVQLPLYGDDDDEPDETVVFTIGRPRGGPVVGRGEAVVTIVDDDAPKCIPPALRDTALTRVDALLSRANCRRGKVTRVYSSKYRKGRVIRTVQRVALEYPNGSRVDLVVSKGKRPRR